MPEPQQLAAEPRARFGNRVKSLRRNARIPVNLVVPGGESQPLQVDEHSMAAYVRNHGRTGLVELQIEGERQLALVDDVDIHPVTRRLLHVVFRHVDAGTAVTAEVPLEYVDTSPADARSDLFVVRMLDSLSLNGLPRQIPAVVQVSLENLVDAGDAVYAGDVELAEGVTLITDPGALLAHVERSRLATEDEELDEEELLEELEVEPEES
ncbi:MAG: 50S ribosomal protein L25 [Chloroflexi bacterium]|nr:50S ribosomal protein L25 [Chloroflexota bacterium]MDE2701766.1 50S ribosomal protein L25 [Chloroflexota bacterium]MDE2937142.1 50S ribosomal protein L25 [Chloroflexota bacterium]MXX67297.1 50S ribosomal protein L25 [Chloroflexota bacterium]MXX99671.1 50S ribosomal protein L25 [Chloroflexota bacterium]